MVHQLHLKIRADPIAEHGEEMGDLCQSYPRSSTMTSLTGRNESWTVARRWRVSSRRN
jgi:hypothetical protein